MRLRPLLPVALLAFLVLVGATASRPPAVSSPADLTSGRDIFRHDTFGDEQLWTGALRIHEAVAKLDPKTALSVGLKVDLEALPAKTVAALKAGQVDPDEPGGDARSPGRQRRRRRQGHGQRGRHTHERRRHLRALPLDGR